MTVKQSGYGVCVHKQDSVAVFGSLHHIDFLAQQVFVQILRYHQIFPARIIAGIPAGLTDIVGIIGQGQIPDQGALSRALAPQNQHAPGIVIPAH